MTRNQEQSLALGMVLTAAMLLYPPWSMKTEVVSSYVTPGGYVGPPVVSSSEGHGGYAFLFDSPQPRSWTTSDSSRPETHAVSYRLDFARLGIQVAAVFIAAAGLAALSRRDSKHVKPSDEKV